MSELLARAALWRDQDPDAETRAVLDGLIAAAQSGDADARRDLESRFRERLAFGTAGLRGELGAGPGRMNRVLVAQTAAGLAAYLLAHESEPSIAIGYDGRTNSHVFAVDTAEIMAGAGVRAILLPRLLPTPVLAFAVRELGASAGVMVTASHNPAADNGYKVYLGGLDEGSQIVAPVDAEIASHIDRIAREERVPDLARSTEYSLAPESLVDAYVARTIELAPATTTELTYAYTAMHGVGYATAKRVFEAAGFHSIRSVAAQQEPDASFPTVAFPNPEEPGAMDLLIALAEESGADLGIANDPDADRLAVAVPDAAGSWRRLSGNEVGSLLGWRAAERLQNADRDGTLAASVVSSPALAAIAYAYNLDYVETLTGFKWVSRVGGLAYGYEEALGYLVDPDKVRDKDGISAALDFLGLASDLRLAGMTIDDHLAEFDEKFGAFASSQISIRVADLGQIPRVMNGLRAEPPQQIADHRVERMDDFSGGFGTLPPSNLLRITVEGGGRVILRPSGTEPKLKVYIDASSTEGSATERRVAAQRMVDELDAGMRLIVS